MQNPSLISSNQSLFIQLNTVLTQLSQHDYQRPLQVLRNSTIGQHVRHILEFYQSLTRGVPDYRVCYDERDRSLVLESNLDVARQTIQHLAESIKSIDSSCPLTLESKLGEPDAVIQTPTNIGRELLYCLEHAIHHMAIIRIGIEQTWPEVVVEAAFGVAPSTIQHQQQCAP